LAWLAAARAVGIFRGQLFLGITAPPGSGLMPRLVLRFIRPRGHARLATGSGEGRSPFFGLIFLVFRLPAFHSRVQQPGPVAFDRPDGAKVEGTGKWRGESPAGHTLMGFLHLRHFTGGPAAEVDGPYIVEGARPALKRESAHRQFPANNRGTDGSGRRRGLLSRLRLILLRLADAGRSKRCDHLMLVHAPLLQCVLVQKKRRTGKKAPFRHPSGRPSSETISRTMTAARLSGDFLSRAFTRFEYTPPS